MEITHEIGLLAPTLNGDLVIDQMFAARRYYNVLVDVEIVRRQDCYAAQAVAYGPAWVEAHEALRALYAARHEAEELRVQMVQEKAPLATRQAQAAVVKDFEAKILSAKAVEKATRGAAPGVADALAAASIQIGAKFHASVAQARSRSGLSSTEVAEAASSGAVVRRPLPWGTYHMIEDAWRRACRATPFWAPLKHHRVAADRQSIAVHFQGPPVEVATVFTSDNSWIQVEPVDPAAFDAATPRGARRRAQRTVLRFRVGTIERLHPLWAAFPAILHRPFPPGAIVSWVKVFRDRHASWWKWTARFTLTVPDPAPSVGAKAVGVDLGWRSAENDELRVAFWHDSDGNGDELVLPASIRARLDKANDIRAIRDKHLNALRDEALPILRAAADLPEEVRERLQYMPKWRSPARFVGLLRYADALPTSVAAALAVWHRRDKHLWQYETGLRRGALLHRREIARVLAKRVTETYQLVVIENFDISAVAKRVKGAASAHQPDWKKGVRNRGNYQRVVVSPSELRDAIRDAARARGVTVREVVRAGTTETCHDCGFSEPWENDLDRMHVCAGCGRRWDRDENAAKNILDRGVGPDHGASGPVVGARPSALASSSVASGGPEACA